MQQYTQGFLPSSFNNVWLTNATRCREDFMLALRNRANLNIPFVRLQSSSIQHLVNLPRTCSEFREENIKINQKLSRIQQRVKGIVSPDWKGLQMISLDRFEV
jgi:hypothetical protein